MPLLFLMKLQHRRLPLRVVEAEEIRRVSVLLATGLIEAEIEPLDSTSRYAVSQAATVIRITEEGLSEIRMSEARVRDHLQALESRVLDEVT